MMGDKTISQARREVFIRPLNSHRTKNFREIIFIVRFLIESRVLFFEVFVLSLLVKASMKTARILFLNLNDNEFFCFEFPQ